MSDSQFRHILRIEWNMRMTTHRRYQRAMRDCDVVEDAAIIQNYRDHMQVIRGLGLIEKKLS